MRLLMRALALVVALSAALVARPRAQAVPVQATGAISGVVADGATHQPIAGAIVALGGATRIQTTEPLRQVTDASGRFVFMNLPALDTYSLTVTRSGYVDGTYGPPTAAADRTHIALADGQWFADANVTMWRRGAIGGRVTDEHGEPVVGVYVRLLTPLLIAGASHLTVGTTAKTDDRGEYRIPDLEPGTYFVMSLSVQNAVPSEATIADIEGVSADAWAARQSDTANNSWMLFRRNKGVLDVAPDARLIIGNYPTPPLGADGRMQAYPMVFYSGALSLSSATPINLGRGESKSAVDITLPAIPTARVSGRVEGMPASLSGLIVRLVPQGLEDLATDAATAALSADGRFTFLNVPAGAYSLDASQSATALESQSLTAMLPLTPGSGVASSSAFPITAGPANVNASQHGRSNGYYGHAPVTVGADDVNGVIVSVRKSVTISGRILREPGLAPPPANTSPALWRPTLEPATGDPSLILPRNLLPAPGAPPENRSPDTFSIDGVLPGEYVLGLTGGFLRPYAIRSMTLEGRDVPGERITVAGDGELNTIVITLTDQIPKLTGTVIGSEPGTPAAVIAFPVDRDLWSRYGLTPIRIRSVGATTAGKYQFLNLPAGDYFVVGVDASHGAAWQDPKFFESAVGFATRVTLGWGDTKTADVKLMPVR